MALITAGTLLGLKAAGGLGAVGGLIHGGRRRQQQQQAQQKAQQEAQATQRELDQARLEEREDTTIQRAVADAQRAGLHPSAIFQAPSARASETRTAHEEDDSGGVDLMQLVPLLLSALALSGRGPRGPRPS